MIGLGLSPLSVPVQRRQDGGGSGLYAAADRWVLDFTLGDQATMNHGWSERTRTLTPTQDVTAFTCGWWFKADLGNATAIQPGESGGLVLTDDTYSFVTAVRVYAEAGPYEDVPVGRPFIFLPFIEGALIFYADADVTDGLLHQIAFSVDFGAAEYLAMVDGVPVDCVLLDYIDYGTHPGFSPVCYRSDYLGTLTLAYDEGPAPFLNTFCWGEAILCSQFIDLTQPSKRARFFNPATGKPANIGDPDAGNAGLYLTGQTPEWYYTGYYDGVTFDELIGPSAGGDWSGVTSGPSGAHTTAAFGPIVAGV